MKDITDDITNVIKNKLAFHSITIRLIGDLRHPLAIVKGYIIVWDNVSITIRNLYLDGKPMERYYFTEIYDFIVGEKI